MIGPVQVSPALLKGMKNFLTKRGLYVGLRFQEKESHRILKIVALNHNSVFFLEVGSPPTRMTPGGVEFRYQDPIDYWKEGSNTTQWIRLPD